MNPPALKPIPSINLRGKATQVPEIQDFKLGYAETERQTFNQQISNRKNHDRFRPLRSDSLFKCQLRQVSPLYIQIVHFTN